MKPFYESKTRGFLVRTSLDDKHHKEWVLRVETEDGGFVQPLWPYRKDPRGVSAEEFHNTVVRYVKSGLFFKPNIKKIEKRVKEYWNVRPQGLK